MRQRFFSGVLALSLFAATLSFQTTTQAQRSAGGLDRSALLSARQELEGIVLESDGLSSGGPLAQRSGPVKVIVELKDMPTARVFAATKAQGRPGQASLDAKRQLVQIQKAQQQVRASLEAPQIDAAFIYSTQRVYNGIAVRVDASKLAAIQRMPGVKAIHPLVSKRIDNASSVPLIGAPELWNSAGLNLAGEGIDIGVIDTGIDYLHTGFGGSGLDADYGGNDTAVVGDVAYPSAKVVGGYDFVGDEYDADGFNNTPAPDGDPMDCNGHGSHVSGSAAGYGVNADGSTYTGAYGPSTPFGSLRIGPGVAPKANLYALKVFGCGGTTDVTDLAIEWAVDPNGDGDFSDHLDVINMSLGSDYGSAYDSSAVASDNAAEAGVIVVTSAGNSGDTYYITGSPGVSGRAISVASSVDSTSIFDGFRVNAPASIAGVKPAAQSVAFDWTGKPPVTADLVYPASQPTGCVTFDASNKALIAGKIVLLDWTEGQCGSVARGAAVVAAGGVGFILADDSEDFDLLITGSAAIPGMSTSLEIGAALKDALGSGTVNVTMTPEYNNSIKLVDNNLNDTLSAFSSRGVRRDDSALKPDIAAPGQSIFSVATGTGDEGVTISGTSMASPHVAGAMAVLREQHPDWTVEELKALAMNTANADVRSARPADSPIYGPGRVGAGRITLTDAAANEVVAYNATNPGLVSVSFGAPEVVGTSTLTKQIRVVNKSDTAATYTLDYRPVVDTPGVSYSLSDTSITVEPNSFTTVTVTLSADAAAMKHSHDPTVSETQSLARHWMNEESGYVTLASDVKGTPKLRLAIFAAPRAASTMQAESNHLDFGAGSTGSDEINLVGQGIDSGTTFPTDVVSLVTAFELQLNHANEATSAGIVNNADLKYVGAYSDVKATGDGAPNGDVSEATLAFGVVTHGKWSSPNETEFDIYIDTNRDGEDDYVLFNWNLGLATGGQDATDVFITVLVNLNTNAVLLEDYLNGLSPGVLSSSVFNTNVMSLPVFASDLGLTNNNATFDYRVISFSRDIDGVVDDSGVLTYNASEPGLDLSGDIEGVGYYADLEGTTIPVNFNRSAYDAAKSKGVLLLHHHNATGDTSEVISVGNQAPAFTSTPVVAVAPGQVYTYNALASDADIEERLAITAPTKPAWLSVTDHGDGTATLSGTPTSADLGAHPVVLRVTDGAGAVADQPFTVTVSTASPTITTIANQTITVGSAIAPISFTVGDADSDVNELVVTATSSNAALVPNANLVVGGSGANRTLTITPLAQQTGTATITLTVSDGDNTVTTSFTLTVTAPGLNNRTYLPMTTR